LIEVPVAGVATIMPDEYFDVYDKTGHEQLQAVVVDLYGSLGPRRTDATMSMIYWVPRSKCESRDPGA
jgi:hypothetical protein